MSLVTPATLLLSYTGHKKREKNIKKRKICSRDLPVQCCT